MDKNENGSTAQFSPEELIKRLKSQLNITAEESSSDTNNEPASEEEIVIIASDEDVAPNYEAEAEEEAEAVIKRLKTQLNINSDQTSDTNDELGVEQAEELYDSAEEADDSDVVAYEENTSNDNGETVEFSVSDLFSASVKEDDTVSEIVSDEEIVAPVEDEADNDLGGDDLLDFISTDSALSASLDVTEITEGDDQLVFDVPDADEESVNAFAIDEAETSDVEISESESADEEELASDNVVVTDTVDDDSADDATAEETAVAVVEDSETVDSTDYSFDANGKLVLEGEGDRPAPDFNMLIALGIPVAEVEKIYGEKAASEYAALAENNDMLDTLEPDEEYEYTAHSQDEEIDAHYKKEKKFSFIKLGICAVMFIFALLFENLPALGVNLGGWMSQKAYPVVNIMVDLQLVLICAVLCFDEIRSGISALLRKSANAGTMLAFAFLLNFAYDITLCFTSVSKYNAKLSGASVIFMSLLVLVCSALKIVFEHKAFSMISSGGVKCCALTKSDDDVLERAAYLDKLSDDQAKKAKVISFRKTKFVDDFFKNKSVNHDPVIDKIVFPASVLAAVVVFVISFVVSKNLGVALAALNASSAVLIPVSVFSAGTLSFAKACSYAETMKAAIIGENAPYAYADPTVVAFEDKDAFPSYCVVLRNLKVYGKIAILDVLRVTTSVFRKIGGPLCDVLENATSEIDKGDDAEIISAVEGGIVARFEQKNILIGSAEFMQSNGIVPFVDVDDKDYLKIGDVSIMYVAVDGELCAKFYIQYTLDVDFEVLLRDLNRTGVCVSVRTSDPNISRRLLQSKLNLNKASLKIVFREPTDEKNRPAENCSSAVISNGTPADLVHTAMLCDRVVHVFRTNNFIKTLSLALGIALLVLLSVLAVNLNIASGLLILYQIFWMIPTLIVAKLFL